ncbi:RNase H domain-containing protein [Caerostris extrusa]|uniref:RNase H domain-containing protein n=1 Tax=Caerostris extrusa TaxID=172846 RepID=A0AAV4M5U1_CAEEX|nr:RNase H domain-containing protein [Caerostris extrusa]
MLSQSYCTHFQWVPSHVGLRSNAEADSLAKSAPLEQMTDHHALSFIEIFTVRKIAANKLWAIRPIRNWYFIKKPGAALAFKGNREMQSAFSCFASGHIRCLFVNNKVRVFPTCAKCGLDTASPKYLLYCVNFTGRGG